MPYLNVCSFMGHVGREAEIKTSKDGSKSWAEFTLAVSVGTVQAPKTMWLKCSVWGKSADKVVEKCKKGDALYVSGRLDVSAYARKQDNVPQPDVRLTVNEWHWLKESGKNSKQEIEEIPTFNSTVGNPTTDDYQLPF